MLELSFKVKSPEAMQVLGAKLAKLLTPSNSLVILMYGALGSGKTTFTAGLVEALPGSEEAEISSPSFNLCNLYPTKPQVLHCDLYRQSMPDDLSEALENIAWKESLPILIIVEWAENLPESSLPKNRLDIIFNLCDDDRLVTMQAHGADLVDVLLDKLKLEASNFLQISSLRI